MEKKKGAQKKAPSRLSEKSGRPRRFRGSSARFQQNFCVVGIGASAGGLEALEQFFNNTPPDTGLAFVVVQHLDPEHRSMMVDLLKRYTAMKVFQAEDGMRIKPNCVYVIPPNKFLSILHGALQLIEPDPSYGFRGPIDFFLRSLAEDREEKAISIILSGTGSDGALGIKAVKGAGGMTLVQAPHSAKYDNMPASAIATGCADHILPPEKMPRELIKYIQHPYILKTSKIDSVEPKALDYLEKIFLLLRSHTGHDFTYYKRNTITRRIERRMAVHQITKLGDYVRYLQQNKTEVGALFKEILIGVTSFFRDPEAFEALKKKVVSRVFEEKTMDMPVRVWVAGCSTGEEAYSVAMILVEEMEKGPKHFPIQIFATDIDENALEIARAGVYPESIFADVSSQRLKHFFVKEGNVYRIKKHIRQLIVFAEQDLIKDPPFSKLDLIVCRNLLIYLSSVLQKKIFPLFHYTLNPNGFLMLGPSESIGECADLFTLMDRRLKIFQRKSSPNVIAEYRAAPLTNEGRDLLKRVGPKSSADMSLIQLTEKALLEGYAPSCVIINEKCDIVHFRGRTGHYLEPPTGEASLNILKMAREGLRIELRSAIHKAFKKQTAVTRSGIRIKDNGTWRVVNLVVKPFEQESLQGLMMVIFEDVAPAFTKEESPAKGDEVSPVDQRILDLEHELNSTKESLQTTIEELETSNEELKSTNEELQSTNEELQSANEDLETSKEELQSINEELVTVNSELQGKLDELSQTNNDMINLLSSTEVGTIFLDNRLNIKRFTPAITKVINLIPSDIGRPIGHIASNFLYEDLLQDIDQVLKTFVFKEKELQTRNGEWYLMKILPYRTTDNTIDGVVITFLNMTEAKRAKLALEDVLRYVDHLTAAVGEPLMILNTQLRVLSVNDAYCKIFRLKKEETEGKGLYQLGKGEWNIPKLKQLFEEALPQNSFIENVEIERDIEKAGRVKMSLNLRRVKLTSKAIANEDELILLAIRIGPP